MKVTVVVKKAGLCIANLMSTHTDQQVIDISTLLKVSQNFNKISLLK